MRIKDIAQSPLNLLDISCRPGLQTRHLAEVFHQANITAIDIHEPFLVAGREIARRLNQQQDTDLRICFENADMEKPPYQSASFDIPWSEAALYFLGITKALSLWSTSR